MPQIYEDDELANFVEELCSYYTYEQATSPVPLKRVRKNAPTLLPSEIPLPSHDLFSSTKKKKSLPRRYTSPAPRPDLEQGDAFPFLSPNVFKKKRGGRHTTYETRAFDEAMQDVGNRAVYYQHPQVRDMLRRTFDEVVRWGFPLPSDDNKGAGKIDKRLETLRLTLTPQHARATDAEIYGRQERRLQR
ncbi:uncharacterized protein VTP21DRAFT_3463 [Calcarisporiella thermophila]|uniref:uncharacterized protein n=1 Tax=Calcarisporiella thermophila TaxID=911321 RepID=UPI003743575F